MRRKLYVFEVHAGEGKDWFVAYSVSDVESQMRKSQNYDKACDYWITRLPGKHKLAVACNRKGEPVDYSSSRGKVLTCAEWATRHPRGYLCSEDY